jgi:hypothetical protein
MEIKLGKSGLVALVDEEDFERVSKYRWYPDIRKNGQRYAKGKIDGRWTRMHRFIFNLPPGVGEVDHEDGDGFNNRRGNLIQSTRAENARNGRKHRDGKSRHRGVQPFRDHWTAVLWLGHFETEEAAAAAYVKAYQGYFGHPPRHPSKP